MSSNTIPSTASAPSPKSVVRGATQPTALASVLRKGAIASFGVRGMSIGGMFVLHWLLARWMTPSEYGTYCYALSVVPLLVLLANLGLPLAAVKLVPLYQANEQIGQLKGFIQTSWMLVAGNSLLISLCLLPLMWVGLDGDIQTALIFALPMLLGFACLHLLQSLLRAQKQIAASQLPEQCVVPLGIMATAFVLHQVGATMTGSQILVVHAVTLAMVGLGAYVYVARLMGPQLRDVKAEYHIRDWMSVSVPLAVSSGIWIMITRVDVMMIGALGNGADVALYTIPQKLAALTYMGMTAMDSILSPMLAEHHAKGDQQRIQRMVSTTANWTLLCTLPLLVTFVVFGESILSLFGSEYRASTMVLRVIIVGQLGTLVAGPVDSILTMMGHHKAYVKILAITGAITALVMPLAIYKWGLIGAACVASSSLITWKTWLALHAYRHAGIKSWAFSGSSLELDQA